MKRIEFIAPVEAMRGNLSGKQTLVYADNDNPAYDAPVGRQYARNYRPSFIGAKRASDGHKYFSVKTKSATLITAASKKRMAILGGAGAVYGAILANKESATYIALVALFQKQNKDIREKGMRKYFCDWAFNSLAVKSATISIPDLSLPAGAPVEINNPWVSATQTTGVEVSNEVLAKFWSILANNPIECTIVGLGKVIAHFGDEWGDVIESGYNVLGLTKDASGYVKSGSFFVWDGEVYSKDDETLVNGNTFELTETQPA